MKRLFFTILLLAISALTAAATELTVSSKVLSNWRYGGSTAKLRIFANQQFVTSDSKVIMQGSANAGTWYKEITCTVSGTTLTIPIIDTAYGYLDSTTDSDNGNATYTAVFYDHRGVRRDVFLANFRVPHSLGTTLSWTQIITYNNGSARPPTPGYYTEDQINILIGDFATSDEVSDIVGAATTALTSAQTANKVFASPSSGAAAIGAWRALVPADIPSLDVSKITSGTVATARLGSGTASSSTFLQGDQTWAEAVKPADTRLERDLQKDYSNNLTTLAAEATERVVNCSQPVTVSASVALPKNIRFAPTGECLITVASGQTLTIGTFVDPGNQKVFTTTGTGKVLFSKGAVEKINTAWWSGNTSGAVITDALNEALESAGSTGAPVYIPAGQWYSTGEHLQTTGVCIEGAGNSPSYGQNNATTLTLQSPTGSYLIKVGENVYSTCLRNIILDGTGTTSKTGLLFEGTGASNTTSGDWYAEKVTFQNFAIGLNQNSLGSSWQMAQMTCVQCIFQNNTTGVRFSSVNHQWVSFGTNFAIGANGVAFDVVAAGAVLISGSEFAGALSSASFVDANVNTGTDTITVTAHPFSNGDIVYLSSTGVLPTGSPSISRRLKIRNATANTVQLEKEDGTDIDITSAAGGGTHTIYRSTSKVMTISGTGHGAITFDSVQDEGNLTFVENDLSDISGIVNITNGSLIQSKIQLDQSMKLNIDKSNVMSHAVQGAATGAVVQITSSHIRAVSVDDGYTVVSPPVFNDSSAQIVKEELTDVGTFKTRVPQHFISPLTAVGSPSTAVLGAYHISNSDENKSLIQFGRAGTDGVPLYYYTLFRDYGNGRAGLTGNQTGFIGYDFYGGDLWVQGSLNTQTFQLTDAATITIDPRISNHQYVTLAGNRTIAMGTMTDTADNPDQTRRDGQRMTVEIIQDGTGSRTCTLSTGSAGQFKFGTDITSITCSTAAGATDLLEVVYSKRLDRWLVVDFKKGF